MSLPTSIATRSTAEVIRSALATAALTLASTAQSVVTLQPSKDATLYQNPTGAVANGGGTRVFIGRNSGGGSGGASTSVRRALIQFDVASALPPSARILSATLQLVVDQTSATQPTTAFAHRVTSPWLEGSVVALGSGGGGAPAAPGESTWLHRDYPTVFWSTQGGDFDPNASFAFDLPLTGATATATGDALIADLEAWRANPSSNHGWLLKTDELQPTTARRCWSREAPANQPTLTIAYMLPGTAGLWGQRCPVVGAAQDFSLGIGGPGGPIVGGATIGLFYVTAPANSLGATIFSIGIEPAGVSLFPSCAAYLRAPLIPGSTFVTGPGGTATAAVTIPIGAPSVLLAAQGVALDPSPVGFTLSNAAVILPQ